MHERGGVSEGYQWATQLATWVRELDPTRPVTNAVCTLWSGLEDEEQVKWHKDSDLGQEIWGHYTEAFSAPLDVVGYNYLNEQYEDALKITLTGRFGRGGGS